MKVSPLIALVMALALFAGIPAVLGIKEVQGQIPLAPTITKSFAPANITTAQSSVLTITVTNPNAFTLTAVSYTDQIPAGLIAGTFTVVPNASCFPAVTTLVGNLVTVSYTSVLANTSCSVTVAITSATPGVYVNTTSTVTSTIPGAVVPPGAAASATLVVTAPPTPTVVASTPIPPTVTPVPPAVMPVIPQVFQHVPAGIFNGTRNNTPTPVRPVAAVVAPAGPATMPVLRPPSTGDSGLADNGTSSVVYGLALIAALTVMTLGATRMRTVRQK